MRNLILLSIVMGSLNSDGFAAECPTPQTLQNIAVSLGAERISNNIINKNEIKK